MSQEKVLGTEEELTELIVKCCSGKKRFYKSLNTKPTDMAHVVVFMTKGKEYG